MQSDEMSVGGVASAARRVTSVTFADDVMEGHVHITHLGQLEHTKMFVSSPSFS